jgi:hypothetical protein
MSLIGFAVVAASIAFCLTPIVLLRRDAYRRTQDYFVSSERTPPGAIQNSSIAYALKMATFGPLLVWGANGDLWPAIVSSVVLGLGLALLYVLRRPMLEFLDGALSGDRSITVHAFIARQHGNDDRIRLLAAGLTVFALLVLIVGEAIALASFLTPVLPEHSLSADTFVYATLGLVVLYTMLSGNSGVMRSAQLQLGMLYLGLFGSTALLLYLLTSSLSPMPPHGKFAVLFMAACCALVVGYRRSRYVDTSPINHSESTRPAPGAGLFIRVEKILNVSISVFAVLVIVVAVMELSSERAPALLADSATALEAGTNMSALALTALFLMPLFHPIADLTNWQRIAAFEKDRALLEPVQRSAVFRRIITTYAMETPLIMLFMCMLGAIAVTATAIPADGDVIRAFVEQLTSQQNAVADGALCLLLVSVFAAALSTMGSAFSAVLSAIRYDILPAFPPRPVAGAAQATEKAAATRGNIIAGCGLYLAIAVVFYIANAQLRFSSTSGIFLAVLFAFYCAQLSFVPLIVGPIIRRPGKHFGTVSAGPALAILSLGSSMGVGALIIYLATRDERWLWAAVPACLGSGFFVFAIARLWPTQAARAG